MRIAISGGHITPALAFMQYVKEQGDHVWVLGRSQGTVSIEAEETEKLGFDFRELPEWKFHRSSLIKTLRQMPQGMRAIKQAYQVLKQERIQIVLVCGGYLSVPVAIAALLLHLPVYLHEQTLNPGIASKFVSRFATRIFTAFPDVHVGKKSQPIGNLVRKEFYTLQPRPEWMTEAVGSRPLLCITGGNQGSKVINDVVCQLYPTLLHTYSLVHQCGGTAAYDAFHACQEALMSLSPQQQTYVVLKPWFSASEMAYLFQTSYVLIGRAGANTVSEIMVSHLPSLLIPLLSTPTHEQYRQAHYLKQAGVALILKEEDVTPQTLLTSLHELHQAHETYKRHFNQLPMLHAQSAVSLLYESMAETVKSLEGR